MADIGQVSRVSTEDDSGDKVVNVEAITSDPASMEGRQGTPSGIDSRPLPGDYAIGVQLPGSDQWAVIGYIDPKNTRVAENGEIRIYSRNSGGNVAIEFLLKSDGTAEMGGDADNLAGFADLKSGFDQLKSQITQNLTAVATAIASLGGTYTVIPLTATIDSAKIDELKVP